MKKIFIALALALLAVACSFSINPKRVVVIGNGKAAEKSFDLPAFTSIKVAGSSDVIYSQGPQAVVLTADENLLDIYTVEVIEGTLRIGIKPGHSIKNRISSFVTVSAPDLQGVKIAGSGECVVKGGLKTTGNFSFAVSGSGDLEADSIACKDFEAHISGSGDIEVAALTSESASVLINGSGDAKLVCRDAGDITAKINGSGDIALLGTARSLTSKVNGSGSINTKGLSLSAK